MPAVADVKAATFQWRPLKVKRWAALAIVFACSSAVCAQLAFDHSSVASPSISREEMSVYEAALSSWLGKDHGHQLVNEQLSAAPSQDNPDVIECTKGLKFPTPVEHAQAKKSLAGVQFKRTGIELIDGSRWKPADPHEGIAKGKSVEAAVSEAFSQSLISFSQIKFSRDGNDALVEIGMVCGSLCGSGSTVHLHKSSSAWAVVSRCGGWVS